MFGLVVALPLSVLLAILVHLIPAGYSFSLYSPHYLLLVMLFWLGRHPQSCGLTCAAWLGLIADLLFGGWLGQQTLMFVLLGFLLLGLGRILLNPTLLQQAIIAVVFVVLGKLWQLGWALVDGAEVAVMPAVISGLLSGLLWPIVAVLLDKFYDSGAIRE